MKQPVDFRPEKPQMDFSDTSPKPSVRLAAALTQPDGRTLLDPPTIELDDISIPLAITTAENDMKSFATKESKTPSVLERLPVVEPFRKISGTDSLFRSGDLLDRLDRIVDEAADDDFQLPEIPPLPDWQSVENRVRENAMTPHADFSVKTEPRDMPMSRLPVIQAPRPAVFRRKVKPVRSLEIILPKPVLPVHEVVEPTPVAPTGRELLLAENLTKSYYKKKLKIPVLKGVNFAVHPGEFVSIVGQSGSGKSTLLHLLGTLDNPESGSIHFEGRRIDNLPTGRRDLLRNRSIGFIFQFYHLLPELSTLENVLSPLMIRESVWNYFFRRREYTEKAKAILDQVGLSHRLKHRPCELSGGEMQRAAIARALVSEPKILLADEPTGNLDAASAREIIALLRQLKDQRNLTIVMVTHDNQIARTADRIVRMVDGVIVSSDEAAL